MGLLDKVKDTVNNVKKSAVKASGIKSWKRRGEKWFGVYMALSVRGVFPFDEKVQNTCDKIIKDAYSGDLESARKWAQNLQLYVNEKMQGDSEWKSRAGDLKGVLKERVRRFGELWRSGGVDRVKQQIEEERDGGNDG